MTPCPYPRPPQAQRRQITATRATSSPSPLRGGDRGGGRSRHGDAASPQRRHSRATAGGHSQPPPTPASAPLSARVMHPPRNPRYNTAISRGGAVVDNGDRGLTVGRGAPLRSLGRRNNAGANSRALGVSSVCRKARRPGTPCVPLLQSIGARGVPGHRISQQPAPQGGRAKAAGCEREAAWTLTGPFRSGPKMV